MNPFLHCSRRHVLCKGICYQLIYLQCNIVLHAESAVGYGHTPEDPSIKVEPSMVVYPNPVQQLLNINLSGIDGISEIAIFNTSGVQVIRQRANTGRSAVDVSALPAGVYMIKALNGKAELEPVEICEILITVLNDIKIPVNIDRDFFNNVGHFASCQMTPALILPTYP